eukprot:Clim_evm7s252 gene=Clim_evmTU7s252
MPELQKLPVMLLGAGVEQSVLLVIEGAPLGSEDSRRLDLYNVPPTGKDTERSMILSTGITKTAPKASMVKGGQHDGSVVRLAVTEEGNEFDEDDTDDFLNLRFVGGEKEAKQFLDLLEECRKFASQEESTKGGGALFMDSAVLDEAPKVSLESSSAITETDRSAVDDESRIFRTDFMRLSSSHYDPSKFNSLKEEWILRKMKQRRLDYCTTLPVRVLCGTFNVGLQPAMEAVDIWLQESPPPEIIVVGFQEVDLSAETLYSFEDTRGAIAWREVVEEALDRYENTSYYCVATRQLIGVYLVVYVKTSLRNAVSRVSGTYVKCGALGGRVGNKGCCAIRMKVFDSSFLFINAHFVHQHGAVERRNANFDTIRTDLEARWGQKIYEYDHVIWMGDFNYRVDLENATVRQHIMDTNIETLLKHDQLTRERKAGRTFNGFAEGPIDFLPTYKFDLKTNTYDTSEKMRVPGYTDRILWMGVNMKQERYEAHFDLLISDHKPVSSVFFVKAYEEVPTEKKEVLTELIKEMDRMENDLIPDVTLETNMLDFGTVQYGTRLRKIVKVTNTGEVMTQFRFIPKLDQPNICERWLSMAPTQGILDVGESVELAFELHIDNEEARTLSHNSYSLQGNPVDLQDIVILHLENGKDYFIVATAQYTPTCFGAALTDLVRIHEPIRDGKGIDEEAEPLVVPKELKNMARALLTPPLPEPTAFLQTALVENVQMIRHTLDRNEDLAELEAPHSALAEAFVFFLASLKVPLVPFNQQDALLVNPGDPKQVLELMQKLPAPHAKSVELVVGVFVKIIRSAQHGMLLTALASMLAHIIIRPPALRKEQHRLAQKERRRASTTAAVGKGIRVTLMETLLGNMEAVELEHLDTKF